MAGYSDKQIQAAMELSYSGVRRLIDNILRLYGEAEGLRSIPRKILIVKLAAERFGP